MFICRDKDEIYKDLEKEFYKLRMYLSSSFAKKLGYGGQGNVFKVQAPTKSGYCCAVKL